MRFTHFERTLVEKKKRRLLIKLIYYISLIICFQHTYEEKAKIIKVYFTIRSNMF